MASTSYSIDFLFDSTDGQKQAKQMAKAVSMLDKDVERLRKQEDLYAKAEEGLNRQLKLGKITKQEHVTLSKRQAQAYRKITGDSSKLTKIYDKERRALERKNKATEIANAGLGRLGISSGAIGGPLGLAVGTGLAAGGGLAAFTSQQFEYQTQLERNADLLGLGARELEGVTYAMSRLAAVSKDEATEGLFDIRERLAEVADDVDGSLGKAARAIGLDAQRLKGLDVARQVEGIVDSLAKLDAESRVFRSRELFGDSASNLLTKAAGDKNVFKTLQAKGEKNAVLLDKQSMDSIKRFSQAMDDLKAKVAEPMARAVESLVKAADMFLQAAPKTQESADEVRKLKEDMKRAGLESNQADILGVTDSSVINFVQGLSKYQTTGGSIENPVSMIGMMNNLIDQGMSPQMSGLTGRVLQGTNYLLRRDNQDPSLQMKMLGMLPKFDEGMSKAMSAAVDKIRAENAGRLGMLEVADKESKKRADKKKQGSPERDPYDMSKLNAMVAKEYGIDNLNRAKRGFEAAGYSEREAQAKAELDKARRDAIKAAREAGASDKEIMEISDKYVTVSMLRVSRIQREEGQMKIEARARKEAQEAYNKSVKAARAAYAADVERVNAIRDRREEIFAGHEARIQSQYERSVALAEGPALKGQTDFTGGSVEEFKFISAMMAERDKDDSVSQAEALAQEQRQRLADMKKQSDEQIEDKLQELRNGLEGKLDSLISAINNKEL